MAMQCRATVPGKTRDLERSAWFCEVLFGARSAAGSMTALSLALNVREHRFQMHHCLLQAKGPAYELAV